MPNESLEDAARREVQEEASIEVLDLEKAGTLEFWFGDSPDVLEVHVFRTKQFKGTPQESEEMRPQWFLEDEIPYDEMRPGDRHWIPTFLKGHVFTGKLWFDESGKTLVRHVIDIQVPVLLATQ